MFICISSPIRIHPLLFLFFFLHIRTCFVVVAMYSAYTKYSQLKQTTVTALKVYLFMYLFIYLYIYLKNNIQNHGS